MKSMTDAEAKSLKRGDLRTLPICFDSQGMRLRDYSQAVPLLVADTLPGGDLPSEGPKTFLDVARANRAKGLTFKTDYERWCFLANIPASDRSLYEAEVLVTALDAMIEADQLNAPNLYSAELLVRRLELIKEAHRINPSNPDYSSADFYMGWRHQRTGVSEALGRHVASEVKDEASRMKELRKAREENDYNRGGGRKSKGRGGRDGSGEAAGDG